MNLDQMLGSVGFVGMCVMGCLAALSLYSVAVIFDKWRRFRAAASESGEFLTEFGTEFPYFSNSSNCQTTFFVFGSTSTNKGCPGPA